VSRFKTIPPGARVVSGMPGKTVAGMPDATIPPSTAKQRLQALGRLPTGQMNKTEIAYAQVLEGRKIAGEVLWWKFEGIKLRLADNCFLTVDFAVMREDGMLMMVDVKGGQGVFTDDSKVKIKVASATYPFVFFTAMPRPKKDGGGWIEEQIGS
jgi:hypothetical protein